MTLQQAMAIVDRVSPRVTYFTHMADCIGLHSKVEASLPANMHLAYDNLTIEIKK